MFSLNCKGRLLCSEKPVVMGILNITPDSFYEGSRLQSTELIISKAAQMIQEGASILDVGGQSTRPGAESINAATEKERVIPAIEAIRKTFPDIPVSVDTYHASVASAAVHAGADMINDISAGLLDTAMIRTVAQLQVPFIAMHSRSTPKEMQQHTNYANIITDLLTFFSQRIQVMESEGIRDIIIDPGFGFAKTIEQNFELLQQLETFSIFKKPILAGLSRKSMIYKSLHSTPAQALNGTSVLHTIALMKGAHILRAHDVKEAMECIQLTELLKTKARS
ncbi:MAG: dihydropteroate synthase [Bacteroidetes bacterium]|nr:dihydropteroate synthase [Bacteroidota bacterium]